jgi:hypothetical protein
MNKTIYFYDRVWTLIEELTKTHPELSLCTIVNSGIYEYLTHLKNGASSIPEPFKNRYNQTIPIIFKENE